MKQPHEHRLLESFLNALRGVWLALREEKNFRLMFLAAINALELGFFFKISNFQWLILILVVCVVLVLELGNSIAERLFDMVKPRLHPMIRDMKDLLAAAVFLASCGALAIGLMIFGPRIWELLVRTI